MAQSYILYNGTGGLQTLTVPFGYIDQGHVLVLVDDVETSFSWLSSTSIQVTTTVGTQNVRVKRRTPREALVQFSNSAGLVAENLNLQARQSRYIAEEQEDSYLENELTDLSVDSSKIADDAVTMSKLSEMAARTVIANDTGSAANPTARAVEDLTVLADGATTRRDLSAHFAAIPNALNYGCVADGTTDNTAALTTLANTAGIRVFVIPPGVKFNRTTLIAALPVSCVALDLSMLNDYASGGETCKHVGIMSKDSAPNDTHWSVDSAHHPVLDLNNFGSAGTTSATERKATIIWNSGFYSLGTTEQQGFRGNAMLQWTKDGTGDYWIHKLTSLAPWAAISGQYELWAQGQVIGGAGVYRANGGGHYVSTGAGTTGASAPVHTSGTVSDGGVSWTYIDSTDRSVWITDQYGRVGTRDASPTTTFRHKVSIVDPTGDYAMELAGRGASKHARLLLIPTNSGGSEVSQPYLRADATVGLRVMKSDSSSDLLSITDSGTAVKAFRMTHAAAADADTTPSVLNLSTLYLSNTGATNITTLDDAVDNQVVRLIATNGNTTLVHGGAFNLTGSVNVTLTAFSSVTMQKVPSAISNRWVEVARSIK